MKFKTAVVVGVSVFCLLCGVLVVDAMVHHPQQTKRWLARVVPLTSETAAEGETAPAQEVPPVEEKQAGEPAPEVVAYPQLVTENAPLQTVQLGALYPDVERTDDPDRYKFQLILTNRGAAVQYAFLSEFETREAVEEAEVLSAQPNHDVKAINPLTLLSPVSNGKTVYSLANANLWVAPAQAEVFGRKAFPLDKLNWQLAETDSPDTARFEALLNDKDSGETMLKLVKTYRIEPGSYELGCELTVENLSGHPLKIKMQMQGPGGLTQEEERQDTRKVMTAYAKDEGVETNALTSIDIRRLERETIRPAQGFGAMLRGLFGGPENPEQKLQQALKEDDEHILWAATTNKYFAAIVHPENVGMTFTQANFYDAQLMESKPARQAGAAFLLETEPLELAAAGTEGAEQSLSFSTYLGPKDKQVFENNDTYRMLQYFQTIDFRGCCCPVSVIAPLAFGVMWLMNSMYTLMGPLGNYGVVIIILVFLVRLLLHPITKKSQVSMMGMQKLGPKMKEIQAKYAGNKQEMNKQVMALYRDGGVSPISGMLPMFLQMPIWIALWTAVNTSIDIRGAGFLPIWITDLASPDHLFRFPFGWDLPFFGQYFNLLPILMGVVMYVQQKMMPTPQTAQPDSQMAQQQKMMMIMMPLMFPVMLYSGPSGVNLYILSSITAGVIEQKVIRKHIQEKEAAEAASKVPVTAKTGGKVKKKKPKPMYKG